MVESEVVKTTVLQKHPASGDGGLILDWLRAFEKSATEKPKNQNLQDFFEKVLIILGHKPGGSDMVMCKDHDATVNYFSKLGLHTASVNASRFGDNAYLFLFSRSDAFLEPGYSAPLGVFLGYPEHQVNHFDTSLSRYLPFFEAKKRGMSEETLALLHSLCFYSSDGSEESLEEAISIAEGYRDNLIQLREEHGIDFVRFIDTPKTETAPLAGPYSSDTGVSKVYLRTSEDAVIMETISPVKHV